MFNQIKQFFNLKKSIAEREILLANLEKEIDNKQEIIDQVKQEAKSSVQEEVEEMRTVAKQDTEKMVEVAKQNLAQTINDKLALLKEIPENEQKLNALIKEISKYEKIAKKHKAESIGIQNLIEKFPHAINTDEIELELEKLEEAMRDGILEPIIQLNLHHQDSKLLKKEMNANNAEIRKLLKAYQDRYTTKANLTIYNLMVIGLQAELQNILYTLSYSSLDKAIEKAEKLIEKYLTICASGNASILATITRFLSELEPLFLNAIRIEYKYYVQKEKEKEEQRKIKEQMRQEAEEQRQLDAERKKIEKEEEKFLKEIEKNKELLGNEKDAEKILALEARLKELEDQFNELEEQKEEIVKRANGRAGYVYVISNLGSFGEKMFKIGMTRRLNPLDRIDELGDASVPFKFDIHAMVFSNNAVDLEQQLHQLLDAQRVNKINQRKEFFYSEVTELQELVQQIDPTVEFTTTMAAAEYRQSESLKEEYLVGAI